MNINFVEFSLIMDSLKARLTESFTTKDDLKYREDIISLIHKLEAGKWKTSSTTQDATTGHSLIT